MIRYYALPSDDLAASASAVTASAEDPEYPAINLIADVPSRPAKLTTTTGYWDVTISGSALAAAIIYHNLNAALSVEVGGEPITIPAAHADGWTVSPLLIFSSPQSGTVRLEVIGANTYPVSVGRLLLLSTLRELDRDVRWGVVENEDHDIIDLSTGLGVDVPVALGSVSQGRVPKRRSFAGDIALKDASTAAFITLSRSAQGKLLPWMLIPDGDVNDAWFVRFEDERLSRTREIINHNIYPFRVRELARGLPWP